MERETTIKKSAIVTFLVFAFLLAWALEGLLALLGSNSSSLATVILSIVMWTPAAAIWITKKLNGGTRILEPSFKLNIKNNIRWYLFAFLLPIVYFVLGGILYFCIFPDQFDPGNGILHTIPLILINAAVSSIVTIPLALGEEIGWRGFLFPAVRSRTTEVKAHILCGVIWGLWHAPAIAMGTNFGTGYPWFPWLGILAFCLISTSAGILLSYVTRKSGSIWPAVLLHAVNNGSEGLLITPFLNRSTSYSSFAIGFIPNILLILFAIVLITVSTRKKG